MFIWATEYCRSGNCGYQTTQWFVCSSPSPEHRHSSEPQLAFGTGFSRHTACTAMHHSDLRKKHVWITRHTSGGTSYLLNHLQNVQKKHRQKKPKLDHYGIQCFSKQSLLWRTSRRGACLCMAMNCQRRSKRCTLCHILCHMPQSFPLLGLSSFWCLRVWGGTAKNKCSLWPRQFTDEVNRWK